MSDVLKLEVLAQGVDKELTVVRLEACRYAVGKVDSSSRSSLAMAQR